MNRSLFKYPFRACICSILGIGTVLMIEALSVYYVLCNATVLDLINNFVNLKIISGFDDFFVEPFKNSSMRSFIGIKVSIKKFRVSKIVIGRDEIYEIVHGKTKEKESPEVTNLKTKIEMLESKVSSYDNCML